MAWRGQHSSSSNSGIPYPCVKEGVPVGLGEEEEGEDVVPFQLEADLADHEDTVPVEREGDQDVGVLVGLEANQEEGEETVPVGQKLLEKGVYPSDWKLAEKVFMVHPLDWKPTEKRRMYPVLVSHETDRQQGAVPVHQRHDADREEEEVVCTLLHEVDPEQEQGGLNGGRRNVHIPINWEETAG